MNEVMQICGTDLDIKEYHDQRVVTFKDIDAVHQRPDGTARRNFRANRQYFIEGVDYFMVNSMDEIRPLDISSQYNFPKGLILVTESGYLMLVKSFRDDLAWNVQRALVNTYFKFRNAGSEKPTLSIEDAIKMMELINTIPSDRLDILSATLRQAGIDVPEHTEMKRTKNVRSPKYANTNGVGDFLRDVDVSEQPTSKVYEEYLDYCERNGVTPVSHIGFSKVVNKILETHVVQKKIGGVNRKVFRY
jgi:hypothetical protein